jgi:hypothetical protein
MMLHAENHHAMYTAGIGGASTETATGIMA